MKTGTLIAIVVLGGYLGLEAYTIRAASKRMEPAYIHNLLVEARQATEICESSALELQARFTRTFQRAATSYEKDWAENATDSSAQIFEQQLAEQIALAQKKVTEDIDAKGCSHPDIKAHFQRYRIYAKKSR